MKTKSEENGIKSAFPLRWDLSPNEACVEFGLTKREYFAAMAMQGLLAGYDLDKSHTYGGITDRAIASVFAADTLLKVLAESEVQK